MNKTILITGVGPNGLGAELARSLATQNPTLLILCGRTLSKVDTIKKEIIEHYPDVSVQAMEMDLSSFHSIREAVQNISSVRQLRIDILINNAGVMNIPERQLSSDHFEMHLATNYLGPFLFTVCLIDHSIFSDKGRIVNVGSNGYVFSPFRFADYNFEGKSLPDNEKPPKELCEQYGLLWSLGYTPTIAYGQSKTAMMLWTVQMAKQFANKGISVICVHPGAIATDLWRHMPKEVAEQTFTMMPMKNMAQGVSTTCVAALDPKLDSKTPRTHLPTSADGPLESSGTYLVDCQVSETLEFARDGSIAKKLWSLSEKLTAEGP
ncbi:MAG: hypothetical protein Q9161_009352 [Pseudevernia consocians]